MAFATLESHRAYYRLEGNADKPVIVLAHALGLDHGMWDPQVPDLLSRFRVLRYDLRGHGASDAPAGDYSIEALGRDALSLLDAVGISAAVWCGLSIGGMVGQWIAIQAADRLSALVLANTSPRTADPPAMEARRITVMEKGVAAVVDAAMARFFSPALLARNPPRVASARETFLRTDPTGYAGAAAAVRDLDLRAAIGRIRTPTLVISGDADGSMPWEAHGAVLAGAIAGAKAVRLACAHVSSLELPRTFTRTVLEFLAPPGADPFVAGVDLRRAVLGREHVERSLDGATDLTRAFQQMVTGHVWGAIWSRPGLDHRTRRLLVLAMTAALGRWEEFKLHLGAALDHGLEWSDVEEVLLQTSVYAGVPAANTGFKLASEERDRRGRLGVN
jgi:3-oxoadipate enol-lactonase/4-carboxymuconolactone decarboxylase